MRLSGKTAFITGAARGIGFEFAKAYVREGARVAIADINIERAQSAAAEIGDAAIAVEIDVSNQESIDRAVAFAAEARALVARAVAAVAVVADGDAVAVEDGAGVALSVAGVVLREEAQADHAARLAHVELRRDVPALGKLVLAPAPGAGVSLHGRRHA